MKFKNQPQRLGKIRARIDARGIETPTTHTRHRQKIEVGGGSGTGPVLTCVFGLQDMGGVRAPNRRPARIGYVSLPYRWTTGSGWTSTSVPCMEMLKSEGGTLSLQEHTRAVHGSSCRDWQREARQELRTSLQELTRAGPPLQELTPSTRVVGRCRGALIDGQLAPARFPHQFHAWRC